jgi:molybdopterin-guanine dinucleotide biosynthesis protein A
MSARVAAILAGGRGARMGGIRKALVEIDGRRIIDRQLDLLAPRFDEVLLVVAQPEDWAVPRTRLVIDRRPHEGPLAGLEAALEEAHGEVFVVACDLPFLDGKLIERICAGTADATVARAAGQPQPLHARYAPSVLPILRARMARGERRLVGLLDELGSVEFVECAPLFNVNTPADLTAFPR